MCVCKYSTVWFYGFVYVCIDVCVHKLCVSVHTLCFARGFDGWCVTSVWSQPFGGNPLGLEDALVLLYFTAYFLTPPLCFLSTLCPTTIAIGLWWSIGSLTLKLNKTISLLCPNAQWHHGTKGNGNNILLMFNFHNSAQFQMNTGGRSVEHEQWLFKREQVWQWKDEKKKKIKPTVHSFVWKKFATKGFVHKFKMSELLDSS